MYYPFLLSVGFLYILIISSCSGASHRKDNEKKFFHSSASSLGTINIDPYCNVTTILNIALNQTVAYLSPDATAIRCTDNYYPLLSSTDILISAMVLSPGDPVTASNILLNLFTDTVNEDGSLSLFFLSTDYPPQPVNCPLMWPPVYLWNKTNIETTPRSPHFPSSTKNKNNRQHNRKTKTSTDIRTTDPSLSFLLAAPLHATAVIETFWSLYRNTSGITGTGSTAAINFLSQTWTYLYEYYEYLYTNRIITIDNNKNNNNPDSYTGLYYTIHPWENLYPSNIVWLSMLQFYHPELENTCTPLPPPSPPPEVVTLLPNWQNISNYENEWCLMVCLLSETCQTSLQLINGLDNAIFALGTEHLAQISEWLKSAQIGTVPGIDPNTANVLTNVQGTNVQSWRSLVSQQMLNSLYTNLPSPLYTSASSTVTESVQDDDNNNGYGWGYDLVVINSTILSTDSFTNITSLSLTDILSLSSISLLLTDPNPLRQGYVQPADIVPYTEPTEWRMNILNRLLTPDLFDYPLLPSLSRNSKNYSSTGSSEGLVSILLNAWALESIQQSIYITTEANVPNSNLDTIANYIRTNSRQMVCDQILNGNKVNNNSNTVVLPGNFDSKTGQSLSNRTTGIALYFPAYISRIFQPPVQPIDPPPAYQGVAYLITILVTELIIVLVATIFCFFVGIKVVLERRKLLFQKQVVTTNNNSSTEYTLLSHHSTIHHGINHTSLSINGSINDNGHGNEHSTNNYSPLTPLSVTATSNKYRGQSSILKTPHTDNEFFSPLSHLSLDEYRDTPGTEYRSSTGKKSRSTGRKSLKSEIGRTETESTVSSSTTSLLSSPSLNVPHSSTPLSSPSSPEPLTQDKPTGSVLGSIVSNAWWAVTSVVSLPVSIVTSSSS